MHRTATVRALEDAELLALGRAEFLAAVTRHPVVREAAGEVVAGFLRADEAALEAALEANR